MDSCQLLEGGVALFHHFNVDLLHVNLLAELWREFGLPEHFRIDTRRHGGGDLEEGEVRDN